MSGRSLDAPAKVNLGLSVLARRGDGYHQIDTLLATVELADRVRVDRRADGIALTLDAPDAPGFVGIPDGPENLAWRAAEAFFAAAVEGAGGNAGGDAGAAIRLDKRIPAAAGLGGGSSDAAAVLCALAELHPEAAVDLDRVALELGSDVPFFVAAQRRGWSAARGRGRGERLEPLPLPPLPLVLVNPGIAVSAAEAYGALQNFSARPSWPRIVEQLAAGEAPRWINALQPGVLLAYPGVRSALTALRGAPELRGALMSGSGSSCFALAADDDAAAAAAARLAAEHPQWWVVATRLRAAG